MNIGFDARLYQKGLGLGRYVQQLLLQYDAIDLGKNTMTVFLSKEGMNEFQPKNTNIVKVVAPYQWYTLHEQIAFPLLLNKSGCDVVHFPHFNVPIFYKKPYVVTIHDLILLKMPRSARLAASTRIPWIYDLKYAGYRFVLHQAVKNAKQIIAPTHYVKNDLLTMLHCIDKKVTCISEAAMDIHVHDSKDVSPVVAGPYVLYVGNAYPHKNLDLLLELGTLLDKESSDLRIIVVGQEDYFAKKFRQKVRSMGLGSRIHHRGFVSDQVLANLYHFALAYVFPSFEEGFGLPGLEAMSYGVPVISSTSSCLPEVYGNAALFASPKDTQVWLEMIKKVRYNSELREDYIQKGFQCVIKYDWRETARETMCILTSL
ncbi:MAG: glycosyltransferase family 1 protein [bacterium]|nr:glycosyltransferase family 1 protein [bacterium]